MSQTRIINANSEVELKSHPDNFYDSVVTDPPYGLSFMGKKWDYDVPSVNLWKEVYRVLKPGGHMLVACGTRTQHRMVVNIEDAGFEIRDVITWHYGSGFPKSLDISKALDKLAGTQREVIAILGTMPVQTRGKINAEAGANETFERKANEITVATTSAAKQWDGWGTALKPATEFFTLCRKPLASNTVAKNVLEHGVGGINIDSSRIKLAAQGEDKRLGGNGQWNIARENDGHTVSLPPSTVGSSALGRFPANVIYSHGANCTEQPDGKYICEDGCPIKLLDTQSGALKSGMMKAGTRRQNSDNPNKNTYGYYAPDKTYTDTYADIGGASRFFYCAKAARSERNKGLEALNFKSKLTHNSTMRQIEDVNWQEVNGNHHPTVKPVKLMEYLVKLITPTNGHVLDPFNGSGTTGIACKTQGFNYTGIEMEKEYCDISAARIAAWDKEAEDAQLDLFEQK